LEKYRQHRYPSQFPTVASIGPHRVSVKIIDVNLNGMRIESTITAEPDTPIHLDILSTKVRGAVRWCHRGYIGVSFTPALTDRQIDTLRYAVKGGKTMLFSPSGLREMR